jgi:hypothetical protein
VLVPKKKKIWVSETETTPAGRKTGRLPALLMMIRLFSPPLWWVLIVFSHRYSSQAQLGSIVGCNSAISLKMA